MNLESFTPLSYHPELLSQLSMSQLNFLKTTRVISANDTVPRSQHSELLSLMPEQYLSGYKHWLELLVDNFQAADKLAVNVLRGNNSASLVTEAGRLCLKIDQNFKDNFGYTLMVKNFTEQAGESFKKKYPHIPTARILTPAVPSAQVWVKLLSERALQAQKAEELLSRTVFLDDRYTEEFIRNEHLSQSSFNDKLLRLHDQVESQYIHKKYLLTNRPELKALDDILKLDNFDEVIIWKIGLHTVPMWFLYHWLQKTLVKHNGLEIETNGTNSNVVFIDKVLAHIQENIHL